MTRAGRRSCSSIAAVRRYALEASADATFLVLTGAPIDEPIAGYGPFVMNTREEIMSAMKDLQEGRFGQLAA